MSNPLTVLEDGQLHFKVRNRATGEEVEHGIDVLILRLTCEECERTHNLQTNARGEYVATTTFLTDLAGRLAAMGIDGCTPSIAMQLWHVSANEIEALKKNTNGTPSSPSGSESNPEPSLAENASGY